MTLNDLRTPTCPERKLLLALAEGSLNEQQVAVLDAHLTECTSCESTLASLEDDSDTLVRSLACLPATSDDELAFQQLHERLLSSPQSFRGGFADDPTEIFDRTFPLELALPFQLGNYDLLEQIGAGAHGAVFRARHRRLDRPVAVKLLLRAAKSAIEDFSNEMRVIGRLDHPHIIRATDAGEMNGLYFLVMEYVAGLDVSTLLQREGSLSVANACEIARQAALGLAFAHRHDLVHRDVKTSNLLFTSSGQVKLLDLGLAKIGSPARAGNALSNLPRGTADYMAPEQWLESDAVDRRADLYSLGCTLHKLITGETPYKGLPDGCSSKRRAHLEAPIPSLRGKRNEVPPPLDQLVQRLMAKEPASRPESAEVVAEELASFTKDADLLALAHKLFPGDVVPPPTELRPAPRPAHWITRRRAILAGAVAVGATLLVPKLRTPPRGLAANEWRQLDPAEPKLLVIPGTRPAEISEQDARIEMRSEGPAMVHLGKPLGGAFRLQTTLQRDAWEQAAGLFFRFRLEQPAPHGDFSFHTLYLRSEDGTSTLVWLAHRVPPADSAPLPLAEAKISPLVPDQTYQLDVALGRVGFPEVRINDRSYPKTSWQVTREGRDLSLINPEQLRAAFSGRIGLFHEGGRTLFGPNRLMYLDV